MTRKEFKEKWLTALRSGKFNQAYGSYFEEDTGCMCTLGVAGYLLNGEVAKNASVLEGVDKLFKLFPELSFKLRDGDDLYSDITEKNDGSSSLEVNPEKALNFSQMADFLQEVLPE